jgi:hypothetical protein
MKKNGITILLALALSVVLVLGTVGVAEAKPVRDFSIYSMDSIYSAAHGHNHVRVTITWEGYRNYGYSADFYKKEAGSNLWTYVGTCDNPLTQSTVGDATFLWQSTNTSECAVSAGQSWIVRVWLLNKNGARMNHPGERSQQWSLPTYAVTLSETNDVAVVYVYIFDNPDYISPYVDLVATNATGEAVTDLPDGAYYYVAIKTGYLYSYGDFNISGAPLTESFTMTPVYTVTFSEANDLEGVYIDIYSDAGRTMWEGFCTTNATGQAIIDLPEGAYYYTATKTSYGDLLGDFNLSGAPLTENFAMALQIFAEDFTGVAEGEIPVGWNETAAYPNWGVSTYWSEAGGITPEMVFSWEPSFDGVSRLITPEIDASAYSDIGLTFRHFVDHWGIPYTLRVQVSVDGGTNWTDAWSVSPTGNIGPAAVAVDLSAYDGLTFQLAWVFDGDSYNIDYWHIDDISVTGS